MRHVSVMQDVGPLFGRLVLPSLVAVYASKLDRPGVPDQVGSAFLIKHRDRPLLVTAKHVLWGQNLDEDPGEKALMINGGWVYIGDNGRKLNPSPTLDLVVTYIEEAAERKCLALETLCDTDRVPKFASFGGYLARDFKRSQAQGVLKPSPLVFSDVTVGMASGKIGIKYSKRNNVDNQGNSVINSIPRGLSGGPILDTLELLKGTVRIVGVFTDQEMAWR